MALRSLPARTSSRSNLLGGSSSNSLGSLHATANHPRSQIPTSSSPQLMPCSSAPTTSSRSLIVASSSTTAVLDRPTTIPYKHLLRNAGNFSDRYEIGELLGEGASAQVFAALDTLTNAQHAVKVLPKTRGRKDLSQQISREVAFFSKLDGCTGLIQVVDICEDADHVYLVTELCTGGNLQTLLEQTGPLEEHDVAQIMHGVLSFLADCHARRICYGDVKPANFVLRRLWPSVAHIIDPELPKGLLQPVAVDCGCCEEYQEGCLVNSAMSGTPLYMSPEILLGCHSLEVDVWAAGVMMYQLLTGRFPFWECDYEALGALGFNQLKDAIMHNDVLFDGVNCQQGATPMSPQARHLICRLLDKDAPRRISAQDALSHAWFTEQQQ